MLQKKGQKTIFLINLALLIVFSILALHDAKYWFLLSLGVLVFFLSLVTYSTKKVDYSNAALIGMTLWLFMHLLGVVVEIKGVLLYKVLYMGYSSESL